MGEINKPANDIKQLAEEAKEQIENLTQGDLKQKAVEAGKEIADKVSDIKEDTFTWIKNNPVKSLALAFLIGCLCARK